MTSSKTAQLTRSADDRINVIGDRKTKARNAKRNIGAKPRGAVRKTGASVPSVESRLVKAAREVFHLGGED